MAKVNRVPMKYNGVLYKSRIDAFRAAGLDEKTQERIRTYIVRHKEVEGKDLSIILEMANSNTRETYRTIYGIRYSSKEVCETFNIEQYYLNKCSDCELEKLLKPIEIFNKYYKNRIMLIKDYNISLDELRLCDEDGIISLVKNKAYIFNNSVFKNFKDFCEAANVNPKNYSQYLLRKGLNSEAIYAVSMLEKYKNIFNNMDRHELLNKRKEICKELDISINSVYNTMRKQKKTFEEAIEILKKKKEDGSIRIRLSNNEIVYYRNLVTEAGLKSYNHIINRCNKSGISIEQEICRLNPNCYIDMYGKLIIPPKDTWTKNSLALSNARETNKEFRKLCDKCRIDYDLAIAYKRNHPKLTYEQVILYYRPDYYINILGELVINS